MKMVFSQSQFFFQCTFSEREIPHQAGFRWDNFKKLWYTPHHAVAAKLRKYGNEATKTQIDRLLLKVEPWTSPLAALPPGLELMPHQLTAIDFSLSRNRSYLGLDPGLGKTIIAAIIAATFRRKVLYICPAFLTRNVEYEFNKWAPSLATMRIDSGCGGLNLDVLIIPDSILINHEVQKIIFQFIREGASVLFIDEAHRYKNETAKRTATLFGRKLKDGSVIPGLVDHFPTQIYMSGTPIPNGRPIELYPLLSKAAPETIDSMSRFEYGEKYCGAYHNGHGWDYSGATNVAELARRVIAPTGPFMLRMRKELLDLPPKLEEVFVISKDMSPRLATMDRGLGDRYDSTDDIIKHQIATATDRSADEMPIATYRRLLGVEKVEAAAEYIHSLMEETDESVLVFAFHKETISSLNAHLKEWGYNPYTVVGDTPMHMRHTIVQDFQGKDSQRSRIIIGNYQALGTGFTLTRATRVLFVEFSWVSGDNEQASDRAHRIGQKNTVLVQYLVYAGSIDKAVIESLLRKKASITKFDEASDG